jgi:hypothetical protein
MLTANFFVPTPTRHHSAIKLDTKTFSLFKNSAPKKRLKNWGVQLTRAKKCHPQFAKIWQQSR